MKYAKHLTLKKKKKATYFIFMSSLKLLLNLEKKFKEFPLLCLRHTFSLTTRELSEHKCHSFNTTINGLKFSAYFKYTILSVQCVCNHCKPLSQELSFLYQKVFNSIGFLEESIYLVNIRCIYCCSLTNEEKKVLR